MRVAVVDLGKTNAKLALVDTELAREIEVLSIPTPMLPGPLYRQPDVETLWAFFIEGLEKLRNIGAVDAIGVTTLGATVALLDADFDLALPVLDYEDEGPDECAADYDAIRPPFSETGSPRLPGGLNVGAQLFWQERRFPQQFSRVAHIVTWPQYWACRLSNKLANDATSLGAHTDLFAPASGTFSSLASTRGWDQFLPTVRRPGERLSQITQDVADNTGLPTSTPVHVGIHDSNASLVPHLLAEDLPKADVSTGTWVIVMALGGEQTALDPTRDTLINVDARGQAVPSARFMGGREYELLSRPRKAKDPATESEDETVLSHILEDQVHLLPAIVHGSGPFPCRTSRWTVAEDSLDDQTHAVVIAHYLALMTVTCLELVGARGPVAVEGPFATNRHYLRMLGAASGRPIETGLTVTGTSVGTAMLIDKPRALPTRVCDEISPKWQSKLKQHAELWIELAQVSSASSRKSTVE